MLRKMFFPILMGLAGCAVLISLGIWQVQRMQWKNGLIDQAGAAAAIPPAPLNLAPAMPKSRGNGFRRWSAGKRCPRADDSLLSPAAGPAFVGGGRVPGTQRG